MPTILNNRYEMRSRLGAGGMGEVHLAYDRLSQEQVALKQVAVPTERLSFMSRPADESQQSLRLALAHEFETLASLRHPHIIGVLDYGFADGEHPFYTMRYLPGAQTILDAGAGLPMRDKLALIEQLLEALTYLHRRGVLHRDLKPENVLVVDGRVRVLDFGLAARANEGALSPSGGSAAYMAPELWMGKPPQAATDLYAVGVLLYELLTGQHPFGPVDASLIYRVLEDEPRLDAPGIDAEVGEVVGRLLQKQPEERWQRVADVRAALREALNEPPAVEPSEIRESYLQAAAFVGRDGEMGLLTQALERAAQGHGAIWLVGGESGVGKTRLLNELRTRALVSGWRVIGGQAVSGGGAPYHVWRSIVSHLALSTPLSELEAGVLKTLDPALPTLLDRQVPEPPPLPGDEGYRRMIVTLSGLLERQEQPTLLLLEDLHWSPESVEPLASIQRGIGTRSLMIVGSYRDDEAPHLATTVPLASTLSIQRFDTAAIAALSRSMLGDQPINRAEVLALLERETEGNAFFLTEVVRTLAEEAGRLAAIAESDLPETVFTGGMKQIIQRRLDRVSPARQPLLQHAAVAGRELDILLLRRLSGTPNIAAWLMDWQEAAVVSVQANQWRFAHDKLREGVLAQLTPNGRPPLHRDVALAMEQLYPDDATRADALVKHWRGAGDPARERHYAIVAGRYASEQFANERAARLLGRALELTPADDRTAHFDLLLDREEAYARAGDQAAQQTDLARLAEIADTLDDPGRLAKVALRQATFAEVVGDYAAVIAAAERATQLAELSSSPRDQIRGFRQWARALQRLSRLDEARGILERGLALSRAVSERRLEGRTLHDLGALVQEAGDNPTAQQHFEAALAILEEVDDRRGVGTTLNSLGVVARLQGESGEAERYFNESLAILREIGDWQVEWQVLRSLGAVAAHRGDFEEAEERWAASLAVSRQIDYKPGEAISLNNMGQISHALGFYEKALSDYSDSLSLYQLLDDQQGQAMTTNNVGITLARLERYEEARHYFEISYAICEAIGDQLGQGITQNNLGYIALQVGESARARPYLQNSLAINQAVGNHLMSGSLLSQALLALLEMSQGHLEKALPHVEEILAYRESNPTLTGSNRPFLILLTCIQLLSALDDPRAGPLLRDAYTMLMERAAKIEDEAARASFLKNVAEHRGVVALYTIGTTPDRNEHSGPHRINQ